MKGHRVPCSSLRRRLGRAWDRQHYSAEDMVGGDRKFHKCLFGIVTHTFPVFNNILGPYSLSISCSGSAASSGSHCEHRKLVHLHTRKLLGTQRPKANDSGELESLSLFSWGPQRVCHTFNTPKCMQDTSRVKKLIKGSIRVTRKALGLHSLSFPFVACNSDLE